MGRIFASKSPNPHLMPGNGLYMSEEWNESTASVRSTRRLLEQLQASHLQVCYMPCGPLRDNGTFRTTPDAEPFAWEASDHGNRVGYAFRLLAHVPQRDGRFVDPSDPITYSNLHNCLATMTLWSGLCLELRPSTEAGVLGIMRALRSLVHDFPKLEFHLAVPLEWLDWPDHLIALTSVVHQLELSLVRGGLQGTAYEHWCSQQVNRCLGLLGSSRVAFRVPASQVAGVAPGSLEHVLKGVRRGCEVQQLAQVRLTIESEGCMTQTDWAHWRQHWA